MHPELLTAVKERIALGYSKEAIQSELQAAGYDVRTIEQVYAEATADAVTVPVPAASVDTTVVGQAVALPDVMTLFKNAIQFVSGRLDLVGYLMIPYILGSVLQYLSFQSILEGNLSGGLMATFVIVSIGIGIFNFLNAGAILFVVSQGPTQRITYGTALSWAKSHFWSLVWIHILIFCVVYGGILLFIIPGLIVAIMVMFSQFVLAHEGTRGLQALLRSRALVKGNGWDVFFKLFLLGLLIMLVLIPVLILLSLLAPDMTTLETVSSSASMLITGLVNSVVSVVLVMLMMHVGAELYRALVAARPQTLPATDVWKYKTLAWLGALIPVIGFVAAIILASLSDARDRGLEARSELQRFESEIQSEVDAKERAEQLRQDILDAENPE